MAKGFGKLDKMVHPFDRTQPKPAPAPIMPPPIQPRSRMAPAPMTDDLGYGAIPAAPLKRPAQPISYDDDPEPLRVFQRTPPKLRMNRGPNPLLARGGRGTPRSLKVVFAEFLEMWRRNTHTITAKRPVTWAEGASSNTRAALPGYDPAAHAIAGGANRSRLDYERRKMVLTGAASGGRRLTTISVSGMDTQLQNELVSLVRRIWRRKATAALKGRSTAMADYLRGIRVEFKSGRLRMYLEGWEAMAREYGWAPHPGGLAAGIDNYTGRPVDMKPIILGGRPYKVIPIRFEGTSKDIAAVVNKAAKSGMLAYEPTSRAPELTKKVAMRYAGQVAEGGGDRERDLSSLPEIPEGPFGRGTKKGRVWEKSIFDDAMPIKPLAGAPKEAKAFVTFRTMSDPAQMKDKKAASRQRRKWVTKGIPPLDLIKEVQAEVMSLIRTGKV